MSESFSLANMTPQNASLNRSRWRLLDADVQKLAAAEGEIWVVTGPAFIDDDGDGLLEYSVIGESQVAVPTHYFKVVVDSEPDDKLRAWGFLVPNEKPPGDLRKFLVSIDRVEEVTGLDLLSGLSEPEQFALESSVAADFPQ